MWILDFCFVDTIGAHIGHLLEFLVALTCYYVFFNDGSWLEECKNFKADWVGKVQ